MLRKKQKSGWRVTFVYWMSGYSAPEHAAKPPPNETLTYTLKLKILPERSGDLSVKSPGKSVLSGMW